MYTIPELFLKITPNNYIKQIVENSDTEKYYQENSAEVIQLLTEKLEKENLYFFEKIEAEFHALNSFFDHYFPLYWYNNDFTFENYVIKDSFIKLDFLNTLHLNIYTNDILDGKFNDLFYFLNKNFFLNLPEIFFISLILIILLFSVFFTNKLIINKKYPSTYLTLNLIIIKQLIFGLFIYFLLLNNENLYSWLLDNIIYTNNLLFFNIGITLIWKKIIIIFLIFFLIVVFYSVKSNFNFKTFEFLIIILLSVFGMFIMISSNNLLVLYLAIELQSLSLYILASYKQYSNFSTEAGLKYFILGALASGFLLFGISIIYGFTGTINLNDLHNIFYHIDNEHPLAVFTNSIFSFELLNTINETNLIILGFIFVIISLLFKLGAAPFHTWLPDVYEGSPTIITAFFAIIPKISIYILLINIGNIGINFLDLNWFWEKIFILISICSIIIGTFGAISQIKIKRLLAYSTITHTGFALLPFILFWYPFASLLYNLIYMVLLLNIFTIIISLKRYSNNISLKSIHELAYIPKNNIILAFIITFTFFSMAGIPPLAGFYSKFFVLWSLINENFQYVYIASIAIVISVIATFYYLRIIKIMFFKKHKDFIFLKPISPSMSYIISYTTLFNIFFIIFISIYSDNLIIYWYDLINFSEFYLNLEPILFEDYYYHELNILNDNNEMDLIIQDLINNDPQDIKYIELL